MKGENVKAFRTGAYAFSLTWHEGDARVTNRANP
jgi:hypothetical protein